MVFLLEMTGNRLFDGWEILFASYLLGGYVRGKVRLHKVVSELQKEGFPVKYHFEILRMGPSSPSVDVYSRKLEHHNLIKIKEIPVGEGYNDRVDYILTEEGRKVVRNEILSVLEKEYPHLLKRVGKIAKKYANEMTKPSEFVEMIHDELLIDNKEEFKKKLNETLEKYQNLLKKFKNEDYGFCGVWLAFAGLVDLAVEVLENIKYSDLISDEIFDDFDVNLSEDAGKYFILNKAIEGLELISEKYPLTECLENFECISEDWDKCKELENEVYAIFTALESNAIIYGYLETEEGNLFLKDLTAKEMEL